MAEELADLWDVPFLLQEQAPDVEGGAEALAQLLHSPPAKILSLGGDALLANHFRMREQAEDQPAAKRQRSQNLVE